mmetsp:Transcript_26154/g.54951  ORF Transcript_26154/g.54951 Transcript_26154/m.54951 type:complete len:88 (+) Transcript_26154:764-1027(+)
MQTNRSHLVLRILAGLRLPFEGVPSCAVVGSAGILFHARYGQEFDTHDNVIRFNIAMSIRLANTHAALLVLNGCGISGSDAHKLGKG